ncbi:DUF1385 domain-containing protein [Patescibacteria group bacterium]|nr:DUF1385 domain-containing protein [Patescibacteria group bacterium]MBU1703312.1 DUF1385 domain-containing protein [Patescibacteria group bacterium]MBU1954385.1 DUF1385 domain-containing protein [Patescibacteria group bacterium]
MNKTRKIDFAVGGQAVIEGVMMRSPGFITVAVRKNSGKIKVKDETFVGISGRVKLFALPFVRGVANLFEMMIVGTRMLNYSANESLDQEEEEPETAAQKLLTTVSFGFSIVFALGISLFLFKFVPLWITEYLSHTFTVLTEKYILFNLVDGIIKTTFFIVYIGLLGLAPSIKRVFEYHGAEHKSIYTYEKGLELTPENAAEQSRFHPRCGTSFILIVFMISIFIYTFVPRLETFYATFALRVLFLPLIAGVSYEFLKWSAKYHESPIIKMLIAPGLWFQRLTTKEPSKEQLEVALSALGKALELEKLQKSKQKIVDVT